MFGSLSGCLGVVFIRDGFDVTVVSRTDASKVGT